jgi:hypothetical protein
MFIADMLAGGNPRSLGNTEQVVALVLAEPTRLGELFECAFHQDAIVRMRASDALEKICRQRPAWFERLKDRLLGEFAQSAQPSLQWHLAQILSEISLSPTEEQIAVRILIHNLASTDDWIVTNLTLESLATFARRNSFDRQRFIELLKRYQHSPHKSIASRTSKLLKDFDDG